MILLALVLGILMTALISWAHFNQTTRFEAERATVNKRYAVQLQAMLNEFSLKMNQVSSLVAAMAGADGLTMDAGNVSLSQHAYERIDAAWTALQVDYGLDAIRTYDTHGELIASWSNTLPPAAEEVDQVRKAIQTESTQTWLSCVDYCHQYSASPILSEGEATGAVVVSTMMTELILAFNRLTGVDIGFVLNDIGVANQSTLPLLGMRVAGLSNKPVNLPILRELRKIPDGFSPNHWLRVFIHDHAYEISFLPIMQEEDQLQAQAVLIENVTEPVTQIRNELINRIVIGLFASFFVMLIIYLLLNAPLRRVTKAVLAIPYIGQRNFEAARAHIRIRQSPVFNDEIDSLSQAALQLTGRLQSLEEEANLHQAEMVAMLQKITLANAFSERILDTAQVLIITQEIDGRITSVNHYGELLLGKSEENLRGRYLMHASKNQEDCRLIEQVYQEIGSSKIDHYYHECTMLCNEGLEREIAWHHSRMDGESLQILSVGVDITLRKRSEEKSLYLADHDQLTGLINRQRFMREVEVQLQQSNGDEEHYALVYMDLDGFKYINDISGHYAGDVVLRMVAAELQKLCGEKDILARMGGDEMALLLNDCDVAHAIEMAERINHQLSEVRYPGLVGNHHISCSIGIVEITSENQDVRHLLANADIAMYQAKVMGKSRWHVFSEGEGLQQKLEMRVLWEDRIKQALREDLLVMQYQPILAIQQNKISHYEALVRMKGEDGKLVPPADFIAVAEESGLIGEIDRFVVRAVVKRWLALLEEGRQYKVAINLSGLSMNDESLLQLLQDLFLLHPELSSQVIFEITETAAVADFSTARKFIDTVRAMGCAFSLDDFGVGFSSFYYLKHLPVDYVKIDGAFIRNLADSPDDQIFVRALTEVARGFGKRTVAEFVGDERSLTLLRSYGVDYAQGYYVGKPADDVQ